MDETKMTAILPHLDVQIVRRDDPEEGTESIIIQMKATPSFEAAVGMLGQGLPMVPLAFWMMPFQASMQAWAGIVRQVWAPWLTAPRPLEAKGHRELGHHGHKG